MISSLKSLRIARPLALAFALFLPSLADAQVYNDRQYYSGWNPAPHDCYYRTYYYRPVPDYPTYIEQQVYYYPQYPDYFYYYNPQSQVFWGRVPVDRNGKALYSMLEKKDRKKNLSDIPESAFPTPSEPPPIPDAKDGTKMAMPPMDIPALKKK